MVARVRKAWSALRRKLAKLLAKNPKLASRQHKMNEQLFNAAIHASTAAHRFVLKYLFQRNNSPLFTVLTAAKKDASVIHQITVDFWVQLEKCAFVLLRIELWSDNSVDLLLHKALAFKAINLSIRGFYNYWKYLWQYILNSEIYAWKSRFNLRRAGYKNWQNSLVLAQSKTPRNKSAVHWTWTKGQELHHAVYLGDAVSTKAWALSQNCTVQSE